MSCQIGHPAYLLVCAFLTGCATPAIADASKADESNGGSPASNKKESSTTVSRDDGAASGCELKLARKQPTVVRDLASIELEFSGTGGGTSCAIEANGTKRDVACGSPLSLRGTDFGVGLHTVKLRSESGPLGDAKECAKTFRIGEPSPCHVTYLTTTLRVEIDNEFDEYGRLVREVKNFITGLTGQITHSYKYTGSSRNAASSVTTFLNYPGVDNSRRDVDQRIYVKGTADAAGDVPELLKTLTFDYLGDGKVETVQTFIYDAEGRNSIIEERYGTDPKLAKRYTNQFDGRGLLKSRQDDIGADGTIDAVVTWNRDSLGVTRKISNTWEGGQTSNFEYQCQ